jgi:hypothetical protein
MATNASAQAKSQSMCSGFRIGERQGIATNLVHILLADGHAGARGCVLQLEADEQIVRALETLARHHVCFSDQVSESVLDDVVEHTASASQLQLLTVAAARGRSADRRGLQQHHSVGSPNR